MLPAVQLHTFFLLEASRKVKIHHISQLEVLSPFTLTDDASKCLSFWKF